jgi:KipI family sensor histidine kinase inhibitor
VTFEYSSDCSLLVYLGREISLDTHRRVLKLVRLMEADPPAGLRNLHPSYCSLLVVFDPVRADHAEMRAHIERLAKRFDQVTLPAPRTVEIPVCYGGEYGPDLEDVAAMHGLTPERVIELHSSAEYVVYFIGFVPGYPYLGGLPDALATPRLPQPRRVVPAGTVGIAGNQAGIYSLTTPGGWRLLGRTPRVLFDAAREPMSLLEIGDVVRFRAIAREQFACA